MQRYLIVALFVVFAICLMQASAAPQEASTPNSIEEALKTAGDSISKAFSDAKPKLDELLAKGQEFFDNVGKKITEEVGQMIPKNDNKAT
ncbi:hypothetical protein ACR8ET_22485 [Salmonella enterica subsp. enterica serovar Paratyphi A]